MKTALLFFALSTSLACTACSKENKTEMAAQDLNAPFGWATCTSMEGGSYDVMGGNTVCAPKTITLLSNGQDMREEITSAINDNEIIIFDGTNGDFILSESVEMLKLENKTLVGINGARICTQFYVTQELKQLLNDKGVLKASTSGGGKTLSNGIPVGEEREWLTRQTIIDATGDQEETYRHSGIFRIDHCNNIIVRNLVLVGPGPFDVGAADVVSSLATTHLWIDHCELIDGMDGNLDITSQSDFVTVSWTRFSYTDRAFDHKNSNLVGASDRRTSDEDFLNITYAYCEWGPTVNARMPMARYGTLHMLNNYYNCAGNGSPCINPRIHSEFLIEGNYFAEGVKNIFAQKDALRWTWKESNLTKEAFTPSNEGEEVVMPYRYEVMDAGLVPEIVGQHAGATLSDPLAIGR